MALIQCDFFSETLQLGASMNVILPQPARTRYPVLYLLHGLSDDHSTWLRRTSIERYADALGLDLTYEEGPGGHDWGYWDRMIQRVLAWLPMEGEAAHR